MKWRRYLNYYALRENPLSLRQVKGFVFYTRCQVVYKFIACYCGFILRLPAAGKLQSLAGAKSLLGLYPSSI